MVEAVQNHVENVGDQLLAQAVTQQGEPLGHTFEAHAEWVLALWKELATNITFAYSDNADIMRLQPLGYPIEWLKAVGYSQGPPLPPIQNQCPPVCNRVSLAELSSSNWIWLFFSSMMAWCTCLVFVLCGRIWRTLRGRDHMALYHPLANSL